MSAPTHPIPSTMRAWTRPSRGPYRTSLRLTTISTPSPPTGTEIFIRVTHIGLNPGGLQIINIIPAFLTVQDLIPELECSGVVVSAGSAAPTELKEPGTKVVAFTDLPRKLRGMGVMSEYVKVPAERAVIRVPDGLKGRMAEVGACSTAGQTAMKMIRTADVKAGQTVLVNGASGGVGVMAVQLAKWKGAKVVGVASGDNENLFIDYRKHEDLPAHLKATYGSQPFDQILDCVGTQALYTNSPSYLKANGSVINVGAFEGMVKTVYHWFMNTWWPIWLGGTPRRYAMFSTPLMKAVGEEVVRLMDEGKLRVPIDSEWSFEDVLEGYDRVVSRRTRVKAVVKMGSD